MVGDARSRTSVGRRGRRVAQDPVDRERRIQDLRLRDARKYAKAIAAQTSLHRSYQVRGILIGVLVTIAILSLGVFMWAAVYGVANSYQQATPNIIVEADTHAVDSLSVEVRGLNERVGNLERVVDELGVRQSAQEQVGIPSADAEAGADSPERAEGEPSVSDSNEQTGLPADDQNPDAPALADFAVPDVPDRTAPQASASYVVREGDTVWDVLTDELGRYPTWKEIQLVVDANGLDNWVTPDGIWIVLIYPGQTLELP